MMFLRFWFLLCFVALLFFCTVQYTLFTDVSKIIGTVFLNITFALLCILINNYSFVYTVYIFGETS